MSTLLEKSWTHDGRPELNRRGVPMVDGPWVNEPDKVQWVDPATDLDCLALRNHFGAWCGYVGLPPEHPWHGVDYGQCTNEDCTEEWCYEHSPEGTVSVHGCLTFAAFCHESDKGEGYGICHTPFPGREDRVWWLGFDTDHSGDLTPYDANQRAQEGDRSYWDYRRDDQYRTLDYVRAECARLAEQCAAVAK